MSIQSLLDELKKEYLDSLPAKCLLIESLQRDDESALLETEFHKLKGTGKTYGVPEISELGEAVESICQAPKEVRDPIVTLATRVLLRIHNAHTEKSPIDVHTDDDFLEMIQRVQTVHRC